MADPYPADYDEDDVLTPRDKRKQRAIRSGYTGPKNNRGQPDTTGTDEIGVMIYPQGDYYISYSGKWKNGKFEGHGTVVYNNDDTYAGDFATGEMHGHGVYTFSNGQVLDGHFRHDVIVMGKHTCPNYTFQGKFENGKIYEGHLIYADGTEFEGTFQTPTKRIGKYRYTNGHVFFGTFDKQKDGTRWLLNGYGEMIMPGEYTYRGQTRDGVRHGKGIMSIHATYSAMFDNDREIEGSRQIKDNYLDDSDDSMGGARHNRTRSCRKRRYTIRHQSPCNTM